MELPVLISRASVESEAELAVSKFHREQQGKLPERVRASLVRDAIYVRSTGIFTATELQLLESEEGQRLVKSARRELRSLTRRTIETEIAKISGCAVLRSYWDLDVRVGEQLEAYILEEDLEQRLLEEMP